MKIYCNKSEQHEWNIGHTSDDVLHLIDLDKGYVLYIDNIYNLVGLTKLLFNQEMYVYGTLQGKDLVEQKLKKGAVALRWNDNAVYNGETREKCLLFLMCKKWNDRST